MRSFFHRRAACVFAALFLLIALAPVAWAQPSFGTSAEFKAVPTFESLGLYWSPPGKGAPAAQVEYKPRGTPESAYRRGLDLWYDTRNGGEYRGSLVHLQPDTPYDIRLRLPDGSRVLEVSGNETCPDPNASCTKTWSEHFPAAHVVHLPPAPAAGPISHVIVTPAFVTQPQTRLEGRIFRVEVPVNPTSGYVVLTHAPGGNKVVDSSGAPALLPFNTPAPDADNYAFATQVDSCVLVEPGAHHLIIRDLELRNCKRHGVFLWRSCSLEENNGTCQQTHNAYQTQNGRLPQTRDIVIEDNFITAWGGFGIGHQNAGFPNGDGGVSCNYLNVGVRPDRVVIQRNRIVEPKHSATSWNPHPKGPNGIWFEGCGKNYVVRHNDIGGVNVEAPYRSTVQVSVGSPAVVTWNNHGLPLDTPVTFTTSDRLPVGLKPNTVYFVSQPQANTFRLATTRGGTTLVNTSGTQSGTHTATMTKFLMDGMGGSTNFTFDGFFWADSDAYQNYINHVFDDGIESEGGNRNVRIWGNYFDWIFVPIANAPVATGPVYVWRNVSNVVGGTRAGQDPDIADRQPFVKAGGKGPGGNQNGGRAYYFHNTGLQPSIGESTAGGVGWGIANWVGQGSLYNFVSHNNIWQTHDPNNDDRGVINAVPDVTGFDPNLHETSVISHDLYNANFSPFRPSTVGNPDATGIKGTPLYSSAFALPSAANGYAGDFTLASTSSGRGAARALNNFNNGNGSDVGAHQNGAPVMRFGRAAAGPRAKLDTAPSPATGPAPLEVTFTSNSTPADAPITGLRLEFGDGSAPVTWTDQGASQRHTYAAGEYTATLTVTDANNRQGTASVPVRATTPPSCTAPPTARLTADRTSGNSPLAVNFDGSTSSAVSPATIASHTVTFGDGASGNGAMTSHTYTAAGQYIAALIVRDSNGCDSAPATVTINVTPPPGCSPPTARLSVTPTTGNPPLAVSFDASASTAVSPATISTYSIDYGDGSSSSAGAIQNHTYTAPGQYTARLVVTDSSDCQSTPATQAITVGGATVTLQEDLNGYAGVTDTHGLSDAPGSGFGSREDWTIGWDPNRYMALMRFPIFAREGGPVPDNATITSATLSLHKLSGGDAQVQVRRLLRSFNELQASWSAPATGQSWHVAGALGANDIAATAEGQGALGAANNAWYSIDVTASVRAFAAGAANHGWRFNRVSGSSNTNMSFVSRDNTASPGLRPTLTVTYTVGTPPPPPPPTVTIQQGQGGYAGTTDTHGNSDAPGSNFGNRQDWTIGWDPNRYMALMRFAIFAAEGGPVPNGATITSATLSLHKTTSGQDGVVEVRRLLRSWNELQASWSAPASGASWHVAGALGANDIDAAAGGQGTIGSAAGWYDIDVTAGVRAFAAGAANHGWRVNRLSGSNNQNMSFVARDHATESLRPRLTITYQ